MWNLNFYFTVLLAIMTFITSVMSLGTMQQYIAKGRLFCGTMPANKVLVKLIDVDRLGYDDVMADTLTAEDGTFEIQGKTAEITWIDPVLKFYHKCDDDLPCKRRWKMKLPKYLISEPEENPENKTLDIGTYNLEIIWYNDKRSCIH